MHISLTCWGVRTKMKTLLELIEYRFGVNSCASWEHHRRTFLTTSRWKGGIGEHGHCISVMGSVSWSSQQERVVSEVLNSRSHKWISASAKSTSTGSELPSKTTDDLIVDKSERPSRVHKYLHLYSSWISVWTTRLQLLFYKCKAGGRACIHFYSIPQSLVTLVVHKPWN